MAGSPDLERIETTPPVPDAGHAAMMRAILAIGRPEFAAAIQGVVRECLAVEEAMVMAFPDSGAPHSLFSVTARSDRVTRNMMQKYVVKDYRDDIDIRSIMAWNGPEGVLIIRRTAGEFTRHYRRIFFDPMGLAERLVLVKVIDGLRVAMSIYGRGMARPAEYIAKIERLGPIILSAIVRDHRLRHDGSMEATTDIAATVRRLAFDRNVQFTRREAQVCAGIMAGLSTTAIALDLGIASSSVITFRRTLYRKLGIVSQAELFSLGLAVWAAPPAPMKTCGKRMAAEAAPPVYGRDR